MFLGRVSVMAIMSGLISSIFDFGMSSFPRNQSVCVYKHMNPSSPVIVTTESVSPGSWFPSSL